MKNNYFRRNLLVSSLISVLVLLVSSTASYISIRKLLDSTYWVNHTQEVIYNLNQAEAVLTEAQTSMRGYLITKNEEFITKNNDAELQSDRNFEKLDELTADNYKQQQSLMKLKVLRDNFFKYLNNQIAKKKLGKQTMTFDLTEGKKMMDNIKVQFKRVEDNEQQLLKERNEKSQQYGGYSTILIIVAFIIALVIS